MIFDEVLLAAREDSAVIDKEFAGHSCIRNDDIELIAYVEGVEGSIVLGPPVESLFRVVGKRQVAEERTRRDAVAILIDDVFAEEKRKYKIKRSHKDDCKGDVCIKVL